MLQVVQIKYFAAEIEKLAQCFAKAVLVRGCFGRLIDEIGHIYLSNICQQEPDKSAGITNIVFFGTNTFVQKVFNVGGEEMDFAAFVHRDHLKF
jgi:hypothetical protein